MNEFGSDFHLCLEKKWLSKNTIFNFDKSSFFLSGRAALYALIKFGIKKHKWKTIYVPSYYCHDVTEYIKNLPIIIKPYSYNPYKTNTIKINQNSPTAIVTVDCFGLEIEDNIVSKNKNIHLIEDLTHNLLKIKDSNADYVFASLRKQLPTPTGGILYTSLQSKLPSGENNPEANQIAYSKLVAMQLKRDYLFNKVDNKQTFRYYFYKSENNFSNQLKDASNPVISQNILEEINGSAILKQQRDNLATAIKSLKKNNEVIINNNLLKGSGLILNFKSLEQRNKVKKHLIENNIYPAVLWPNQKEEADREIENTMLFVHIDYRYSEKEIIYIANTINKYFND